MVGNGRAALPLHYDWPSLWRCYIPVAFTLWRAIDSVNVQLKQAAHHVTIVHT